MIPEDRPLAGVLARLLTTVLLSSMFAIAKLVENRGVGLFEIVFFRQALVIVPVLAMVVAGPGLRSLKTRRPLAHLSRSAVGLTGMTLNFATVALLPLAESQTLWFATPLFATILSVVLLGEQVGRHRWAAVALGFVGVMIVIQPQSGHLPMLGATVGLAAGVMTAGVSILLRQLGRTEAPLTTVFWFGTMSAMPLALASPWFLESHDALTWWLIVAMGLIGGLGQIAQTYSLQFAPVSLVAPIDYASLIWSVGLGALLFDAWPTHWTWIGAPVIVISGLYIVWREHWLKRQVTVLASS